ncbi:hypothetical protein [Erysipelothrix rhusiopathiae]|uniref:hypothetical protein n=1 Tax=Erysipelothrix rhusiopathiae TaxID=1648 RepID=UPI002B250602|nr:hypothetical protein [Erysipelothrix rhusiopathiae]WRB93167.1 hypothetical protein LL063_00905 [Erysipelothrix rhusiopathiae]
MIKTKKEYDAKRNEMIEKATNFANNNDLETSKKDREEINKLDEDFSNFTTEKASIEALDPTKAVNFENYTTAPQGDYKVLGTMGTMGEKNMNGLPGS